MTDTKEIKKASLKVAMVKAYTPLVTALISLIGVAFVGYLQFGTAKESSVKVVVDQINNKIIPQLQTVLHELSKDNMLLRERVAKLEGSFEERTKHQHKSKHSPSKPPKATSIIKPSALTGNVDAFIGTNKNTDIQKEVQLLKIDVAQSQ